MEARVKIKVEGTIFPDTTAMMNDNEYTATGYLGDCLWPSTVPPRLNKHTSTRKSPRLRNAISMMQNRSDLDYFVHQTYMGRNGMEWISHRL